MTSFIRDLNTCTDIERIRTALKNTVSARNQMGGALYWNILNEEACLIGSRLVDLGEKSEEVQAIIGKANCR